MKISDSGFQTAPGLRFTMGEILSDGSVIDRCSGRRETSLR